MASLDASSTANTAAFPGGDDYYSVIALSGFGNSGAVLAVEQSTDNVNWSAAQVRPRRSSTLGSSISSDGTYYVVNAAPNLRVRPTTAAANTQLVVNWLGSLGLNETRIVDGGNAGGGGGAVSDAGTHTALGAPTDASWSGSGAGSITARLGAIRDKLFTTLSIAISGALPAGSNTIGAVQQAGAWAVSLLGLATVSQPDVRATAQTVSATTIGNAYTVALANGQGVVGFAISGLAASGATLTFEASNDGGSTWQSVNALSPSTNTFSITATIDGNYRVNSGGHTNVRARVSSVGTGSITFASNASIGNPLIALSGPASTGDMSVVSSASFSRPANTTAYAAGQLVANNTTAASVVPMALTVARYAGAKFKITRARLAKNGTAISGASFTVHLYTISPTSANGDGSTWSTSGAFTHLGSLSVGAMVAYTDGAAGEGTPNNANGVIVGQCAAGSTTLYALLVAQGAYTPVSGETFMLTLEGVQD